ncbi:molybdopterin oxidoreductase family protein [Aquibaculum arenosum]|uniref:Molybdopterin oxidoreductase family protein n=1 Tax=Aquibaculum arenosum TaxID=3032591 RepID=A0ABT5YKY7_9PROT|nr:molybdopterin oxidoreductase family protein [Fodinicurvata sp. CAU 1616]MDF2095616.1 molybdopterin oxidoreductase family protein [Fodinicurvata sp. CAU 1616]
MAEPRVETSLKSWDEVKSTTCYMCACRCGIQVHLKDGQVRHIEGNRDHPVNKGVLCGKGSAGIQQHLSPARLTQPLRRVGPRGAGQFEPISWDEALATASGWLAEIRASDPRKLAFFTGRDQSQALTGWWAQQFGTPNFAAHGGFCSVNMAAAGLYTFGGSFWEFGEPDWEHTRLFLLFGVAEDHSSNPIKIGLGKLKARGAKVVSINPVRSGYSAIADEWVGIRPGTDGLLVGALIHELLRAGKVDLDYLQRHSDAAWLLIQDPGGAEDGLIARNEAGEPLVRHRSTGALLPAKEAGDEAALHGACTLADGRKAIPSFQLLVERFLDEAYSPERVAEACSVPAETIRRLAAEIARAAFEEAIELDIPWTDSQGRRHEKTRGRPVALHAMRGISAHSNGFQTCRLLHLLQLLIGSIDVPGGFLYKPPYPKPPPPGIKPAGKPGQVEPGKPLPGPPLGFVTGPEDLLVDVDGQPQRIDKAFSWEAPLAAHGLMQRVIANAAQRDPYGIDLLFLYMANMSWNSAVNVPDTIAHLTATDPDSGDYVIPRIIYSDAYASEMVAYTDLILPDTTYLERWDCISLLDRPISDAEGAADAIRQPVVAPDRDVRPFQDVLLDLGARLGLPGMTREDGTPRFPGGYSDYIVNHERAPGVGPLAGFRGEDGEAKGKGTPHPRQLERYIEQGCFWRSELAPEERYYRFANQAYLDWAVSHGFLPKAEPITLRLYCEPLQRFRLAGQGHGPLLPPERERARLTRYFDPLPFWYQPLEEEAIGDAAAYPLHAVTQRPMAMYHSWGSQNAWLRQIHGWNRLYMARARAEDQELADGDWVALESPHGRIVVQIAVMEGVNPDTVWTWNAIGKRSGAWNLAPDAPEARKGFLLNHLIGELLPEREGGYRYAASDPITGQAAWYDLRVRLSRASPEEAAAAQSQPQFATLPQPPGSADRSRLRQGPAGANHKPDRGTA